MTDPTTEQLEEQLAELRANRIATQAAAAALTRDRSERRFTRVVVAIVVVFGLVLIGLVLRQSIENGEAARDARETSVRIECLFDTSFNNPPAQTPEEAAALLDLLEECVETGGPATEPQPKETP
jgi:hypothetical protein